MSGPVVLAFPADTTNIALARSLAAAMAARADLPIDQLEDVRLAVDEAVTQAVSCAVPASTVECRFTARDGWLDVEVRVPSATGEAPSRGTFGWTVLSALVDSADADVADGILVLRLRATRATADRP